jgi:hypothetical protein
LYWPEISWSPKHLEVPPRRPETFKIKINQCTCTDPGSDMYSNGPGRCGYMAFNFHLFNQHMFNHLKFNLSTVQHLIRLTVFNSFKCSTANVFNIELFQLPHVYTMLALLVF